MGLTPIKSNSNSTSPTAMEEETDDFWLGNDDLSPRLGDGTGHPTLEKLAVRATNLFLLCLHPHPTISLLFHVSFLPSSIIDNE